MMGAVRREGGGECREVHRRCLRPQPGLSVTLRRREGGTAETTAPLGVLS